MEKRNWLIIFLITILVVVAIFAVLEFSKVSNLKTINNQLEEERTRLSQEKEQLLSEREELRNENKKLNSQIKMMEEDVNKIYKSCMTENACKGKYPGIRWECNNVGDFVEDNPTHVCVCDSSCKITITPK